MSPRTGSGSIAPVLAAGVLLAIFGSLTGIRGNASERPAASSSAPAAVAAAPAARPAGAPRATSR